MASNTYYGGSIDSLQAARTAAETNATRIAIQKLIQETAAQEAAARRQEQGRNYELQRQQLAQQGAYQQGMLGRYNSEAINRQARELFDQNIANREIALREKEVGFRDPSLITPIQMQVLQAKATEDEREKALIEQGLFVAAQNATGPLNQQKDLRAKLFAIDQLQPELDRRIKEYDTAGWGWTSKNEATKRAGQEMMSQFPQGYIANTNIPFASNMELARSLFNNQLKDLAPITEGISPELMNRIQPTATGYTARALFPMTSTSTNAVAPMASGMFTNTPSTLTTSNAPPIMFGAPATNAQPIRSPDGKVAIRNKQGVLGWVPEHLLQAYLNSTNGYTLAQ